MPTINCETGEITYETPEELAAIEEQRGQAVIPQIVSPRQIKLALLAYGLLDDIEVFVASADRSVQISWEYALEWQRQDSMLKQMSSVFGLNEEQVDDLFRLAATF